MFIYHTFDYRIFIYHVIVMFYLSYLSCFICCVIFLFYFILVYTIFLAHFPCQAHLTLFAGPSPAQLQGSCKLTQEWRPKLHNSSIGPMDGLLRMRPTKQTSPYALVRDPAGLLHLSPSHAQPRRLCSLARERLWPSLPVDLHALASSCSLAAQH